MTTCDDRVVSGTERDPTSGSVLCAVDDLSPEQRELYERLPLDLTRGLLLTRSSAGPYLSLGQSFQHAWISPALRELIIVRVAALTHCEYERFHHVPLAAACGVPAEVVDATLAGSEDVGANELNVVIAFVDHLVEGITGEPPKLDTLREHFSNNEIAEIVLLVGHYLMTSIFVSALGIMPEQRYGPPNDPHDGPPRKTLHE